MDRQEAPVKRLRTVLVGAGSLGRALLRRIRDHGAPIDLLAVISAHHGRMLAMDGVDPSLALNLVESEGLGETAPADIKKLLELTKPELMIECIPQNIRSGEPALGFIRTALDMGVNVITANKSAIALGYRDLRHRAAKNNVVFRFEAAVLDGMPLFSMVSRLPEFEVKHVRGVLNGTSSLVLEAVQAGSTRSRGLARAQAQGIAEADAVLDLDGWDAAAKIALLANVWMGGALRVVDVARTGCDALTDEKLREAGAQVRYRLVAEAKKGDDGGIRASVALSPLEPGDPFHALRGSAGAISLETKGGHALTLLQNSSGLDDAAYGLVQDCYAIIEKAPQV
jgi:homoserine dehydrogenase